MPAYFDEKTASWYCKFYYQDSTGKRRQKLKRGFKLQREAKAWEADFLARQAKAPDMPFSALAARYLEDIKVNNKQISYYTRKKRIDSWLIPAFGDVPINAISPERIRRWQNELKASRKPDGSKYSPAYLNNIITELSAIMNYAVRFYALPANPLHIAGNTAGHKVRSLSFWTREEFNKFINTFSAEDPYKTLFLTLYYTGIRKGELQALTLKDFRPDTAELVINKTYHVIDGKAVITAPKTKKANRTISLPAFLVAALTAHCERLYKPSDNDRIFPYSENAIDNVFRKHITAAGVRRIRIHDLRHSHASLLIELGFSALLVAERLGHENVSTTLNIYSHLFPSKQAEVADRLQKLVSN